ncbi:nicotinate-nucleotide adenylyltransferase [Oceanobacillus halotolerans]|uniref:nicotinate-nucleotide adenylyltransferase n=1 Tax=Oceanobacillus halotolerans TaxID=2663380 RepID=UPI0013DD2473|nr:nicotinate-nucleotide adenylyltransferase [Oceanobacillus halotolerans]
MKQIGILGGTFDPPHIGHLIIAEEVRLALSLEQVWFMPSNIPPHKEKAKIDAQDRVKMVRLATENNPNFVVNTIEIERLGKSYTFDTMKILKNEHPDKEFYFIIGADMVEYLPKWQSIDQLMELVKFIGVKRYEHDLKTNYPIIEVSVPTIEVSSTGLRKRLANRQSVRYFIPDKVEAYIKEKHLYE